jgi:hypothetical protein
MEWTETDVLIKDRLYECIEILGGMSDILGSIGSWKDTLSDQEVLACLDLWIESTLIRRKYIEEMKEKVASSLNIQDFEKEETENLIAQITADLGKQDPFILKVNHQRLMLRREKEKLITQYNHH